MTLDATTVAHFYQLDHCSSSSAASSSASTSHFLLLSVSNTEDILRLLCRNRSPVRQSATRTPRPPEMQSCLLSQSCIDATSLAFSHIRIGLSCN